MRIRGDAPLPRRRLFGYLRRVLTPIDINRIQRNAEHVARQHERGMRRRPYQRLPNDHPDFDAEDLPRWWQRWFAEGVGGLALAIFVFAVAVYAHHYMPNPLPDWLAALTRLVVG